MVLDLILTKALTEKKRWGSNSISAISAENLINGISSLNSEDKDIICH